MIGREYALVLQWEISSLYNTQVSTTSHWPAPNANHAKVEKSSVKSMDTVHMSIHTVAITKTQFLDVSKMRSIYFVGEVLRVCSLESGSSALPNPAGI